MEFYLQSVKVIFSQFLPDLDGDLQVGHPNVHLGMRGHFPFCTYYFL